LLKLIRLLPYRGILIFKAGIPGGPASFVSTSELLHGPLPGPFLLSYWVFDFIFSLFFRFWTVREIKLVISLAFERTLIYGIVSYRILSFYTE